MLRELLSPRSTGGDASDSDSAAMDAQLAKLLGRRATASDPSYAIIRDREARLPLSPLIVERLCFELEKRGALCPFFPFSLLYSKRIARTIASLGGDECINGGGVFYKVTDGCICSFCFVFHFRVDHGGHLSDSR